MDANIQTVDEYIAGFPKTTRDILIRIRQAIAAIAPGSQETISYGIPTFDVNNKHVVHYAGYKNHIGFYPGPMAIEVFASELVNYKVSKGTIQFPINKPIPIQLIQKLLHFV